MHKIIIRDTRESGYIHRMYCSQQQVDTSIRRILSAPRHDSYYRQMLGIRIDE